MTRALPDPGHAALVARVQWRRKLRNATDGAAKVLALGFTGVMGLVFTLAVGVGGYFGGQALVGGELDAVMAGARYVAAAVWVGAAGIVAFRTVSQGGRPDAADGLLTTVSHVDVAGGLLLTEYGGVLAYVTLPALAGAGALAAGTGSPLVAPAALLALLGSVTGSVAVGFAAGLAVAALLVRSELFARYKTVLGLALFLAYMGLLTTNTIGSVVDPVVAAARASPVAWYADLALAPLAVGADGAAAAAAVVGTPVVVVAAVAATGRAAEAYWYADAARAEPGTEHESARVAAAGGALARVTSRPTAWVARKAWLRARRAPLKLLYVVYPLFMFVQPLSEAVTTGRVPPSFPVLVALYGAWATGAAFALNPFGDEGAVLPVTLTTPVDGRRFVGGLVVAGALVGGPVTLLATVAAGVASPLSPLGVLATGVAALVLPVATSALAAGAGTAFPRFEAARLTRSRQAVVPSIYAFGLYSVLVVVAFAPAVVAQVSVVADAVAGATGLPAGAVTAGGVLLGTGLAALGGAVAFAGAARRFDGYVL
ncbi:MAG: hypothetical protein ABEJ70_05380 [Halobacteriaceae archaeon]